MYTHVYISNINTHVYTCIHKQHQYTCIHMPRFACVAWLMYMCGVKSGDYLEILWNLERSVLNVSWQHMYVSTCDVTRWLIHTSDMTYRHEPLIHMCAMTHSRATWRIHTCDMTHSYVWHDAFIRVTWVIHIRGFGDAWLDDSAICDMTD